MKILELTGAKIAADAVWNEPRGILQAVHLETAPGYFIHINLGSAGLSISRGEFAVNIPMSELLRLVTTAEPRMMPTNTAKAHA